MKFKAVEWTRKIRDQIHRETEGMSWPEYKAYIEKRARAFDARLEEARRRRPAAPQAGARD